MLPNGVTLSDEQAPKKPAEPHSMFRPPKPRQFQYHFIYSNPEEKELEKRVRFVRAEARREQEAEESGQAVDVFGPLSGMHSRRHHQVVANRRLVIIVAVLLAICALILFA